MEIGPKTNNPDFGGRPYPDFVNYDTAAAVLSLFSSPGAASFAAEL